MKNAPNHYDLAAQDLSSTGQSWSFTANALETDPVRFLQMCMEECHPATWKVIAPFMETALTKDELRLLNALRAWVGGPYLSALTSESRTHFDSFMASLRTPSTVQ